MTASAFMKQWWPMMVVAGSGLLGFGSLTADVSNSREKIRKLETDHDVLIRMDATQEQMSKDITDMKADIKEIAKAVK